MADIVKVGMAQSMVVQAPGRLACFGVGSCVCLALYDPEARLAGLAHSMLPMAPAGGTTQGEERAKYADTAVAHLVESMEKMGARRSRLQAKLIGGATMFSFGNKAEGVESLGERNLRAARASLQAQGIALLAEDSGGNVGRSIEFDPQDGSLLVRSAWSDLRWL
jgi:chemotaxis protein CheD